MDWRNKHSEHYSLFYHPDSIAERNLFQIIKWQDDTVTLSVPTSAHSAKIRQVVPRLVASLQARGWRIEQIRIRVMAPPDIPAAPPRLHPDQRPQLGNRGVQAFAELQEHVRPGPLADAIARLIQRRA